MGEEGAAQHGLHILHPLVFCSAQPVNDLCLFTMSETAEEETLLICQKGLQTVKWSGSRWIELSGWGIFMQNRYFPLHIVLFVVGSIHKGHPATTTEKAGSRRGRSGGAGGVVGVVGDRQMN